MTIELPERDFKTTIIESQASAIVLFYMRECPYCRQFLPEFRKLSNNMRTKVVQVDITGTNSSIWEDYGIEAVPTVVVFKEGKARARADAVRHIGLTTEHIQEMIRKNPDCFA